MQVQTSKYIIIDILENSRFGVESAVCSRDDGGAWAIRLSSKILQPSPAAFERTCWIIHTHIITVKLLNPTENGDAGFCVSIFLMIRAIGPYFIWFGLPKSFLVVEVFLEEFINRCLEVRS